MPSIGETQNYNSVVTEDCFGVAFIPAFLIGVVYKLFSDSVHRRLFQWTLLIYNKS